MNWAIVAARLLQFGSGLVLFGAPLFYLYGFKAEAADWLPRRWGWVHVTVLIAALGALVGVLWWIAVQAAIIFPDSGAFDRNAISILLTETRFGRVTALRAGILAVGIALLTLAIPGKGFWVVQSLVGAFVVASFAWTGHGIRDDGIAGFVHLSSDVLHLLAAGVWIGALVPLSMLVLHSIRTRTDASAKVTYQALERFSGIGPAVVAILILTGLVNSWFLIGLENWRELFTTAYGLALILKLILFGGMLLLAAANRFWLSSRLGADLTASQSVAEGLRALRMSVFTETALAVLVLATVALLGTLEPPIAA